jgi:glycogen operon protein
MDRLINTLQTTAAAGQVLEAGRPWPMGASFDGSGVNFAVFSAHATQMVLCLFDEHGEVEQQRLPLPARTGDVWHGRLPGARPGLVYGLRAHGPWRPDRGHRFNPHKLLLDPWARAIVTPPGGFDSQGPHQGAEREHPQHQDTRDNGPGAFKARVVHDHFDWQGDGPPATPLIDTVLYEVHVRGFTQRMPGVPEAQRGTYAGLASEAALAHLQRLGITAVSLLPVLQILDEPRLREMGLVNYWGYNTLGFFCPDPRYAATAHPRQEFREMVRRLHAAGIEVMLDVVFNHTPEGDERGATLSWRGLDNASYYRLAEQRQHYENWSGCGNTLDIRHPRVLQMVMDSLRYWVQEMHVDGFRFDLAPVLGRGSAGFERDGPFFKAVLQDPALQGTKLIAEPWDLGPGGYQVGGFPRGWLEWNDRFRDTTRAFWLGGDCTRGEFALRLAGSSDLYQARQRSPLESVNYVVSHDGFTLHDLVSYDLRHNDANGENNRDGHGHNLSWNCGWEGPTQDPAVLQLRVRLKRALLATVLLAQGTPMLAAGDELGHTQGGNNNPYCQDNPITWIAWDQADQSLIEFTAHLLALRRRLLPLGDHWYSGLSDARGLADLAWMRRTGEPMAPEHWDNRMSRILGAWIGRAGRSGAPLLLLVNGRPMDASFQLPPGDWVAELDTTQADGRSTWRRLGAKELMLGARSLMLLRDAAAPGAAGASAASAASAAAPVPTAGRAAPDLPQGS